MDFLDIMMELRKRHKIEVPEADYPRFATLGGSVDYLAPLLGDVAA
jgi:acyl carrier protein